MKWKITSGVVAVVAVVSLSACGGKQTAAPVEQAGLTADEKAYVEQLAPWLSELQTALTSLSKSLSSPAFEALVAVDSDAARSEVADSVSVLKSCNDNLPSAPSTSSGGTAR